MPTVRDMLRLGASRLRGDDARREAEILLTHASGKSRAWLAAHSGDEIGVQATAVFEHLVARRAEGMPVAYLTGVRGFGKLELDVTPDVLIPRPETELLVELALQRIPDDACSPDKAAQPRNPGYAIADLGTGSGAVALAIAKARPRRRVLATDASDAALAVARHNASRNGIVNVAFARGDWCTALGGERFDLVVSNPPYIAAGDPHLGEGDLRFEPCAALVSGADGLDAIRVIVREVPAHLHAGGWLMLEHGFDQGEAVCALLAQANFQDVFTARDPGNHERVSGGRRA